MRRLFSGLFCLAAATAMLFAAGSAGARESELFFSAAEAIESDLGKARLFDIKLSMAGQPTPAVQEKISQVDTNQTTRGAFRDDKSSCDVAFLSALRELQSRAQSRGADAVIDIVSVTRGKETQSPTEYRCVAGNTVVHVGLKGTLVKLK